MYVTTDEVYNTAGITSDEVSLETVEQLIRRAEDSVDRFTNTTYWNVEDYGTLTSSTNDTVVDTSKSWDINGFTDNCFVWIYSGTGSDQVNKIISNTNNTLHLENSWSTNPDNTSKYRIIHTGEDPYIELTTEGTGASTIYLNKYPFVVLESAVNDGTNISLSNIYQYQKLGKLVLKSTAEVSKWSNSEPQQVVIKYWYGVYPIPGLIKRLTSVYAALKVLEAQMGGTHNIPSTYSLPEGSVTIGQAYINIRGTYDVLMKEKVDIENKIIVYASFA